MTVMIELVGEQYLPNVLPVRHYHPENVLLVYTSGSRGTSQQYQRLTQLLKIETSVEGLLTDAYDVPEIVKKLGEKLQEYQQSELFFNLTGGTKAMVLAAHQLAMQYTAPICYLQSEGIQNTIYRYDWQDQHLARPSREYVSECLTLREVLDLHLGQGVRHWNIQGSSLGTGGRFEQAIADILLQNGYEVINGVKILGQVEIDVIIRYQNQIGIIEAKTGGKAGKLEGVQQLSTAVRQLGTYTKQFLVLNRNPESRSEQQIVRDASKINLIQQLHFGDQQVSLTSEDANLLLAEIDRQMKGSVPL